MIDAPKTKKEARKYKYGSWAGNPKGYPHNPEYCAYEVWPNDRAMIPYQCNFKAKCGPDNLYCKRHAKKVAKT